MFLAPWFAIAGLVAAAGPIIIHLLNRRRYRTVRWAAMDFLREAVVRSRRILQLRDLLLLALRTACVLLFGLAMARPFLGGGAASLNPNQPVHAVLLVDNSLSTAYQRLGGTVLDEIKQRAQQAIDALPRGSRIAVLPVCGSPTGFSHDAYYTKEDAIEALGAIRPVDRALRARETLDLAIEALQRVPGMASKRVVLFTDPQPIDFSDPALAESMARIPGGLAVDEVPLDEVENAWVADVKLREEVADLQTPGVFVATLRYEGAMPRQGVEARLVVGGVTVAAETVDLQPGQSRQIEFPPTTFDAAVEAGRPAYLPVEVSIRQDRLPDDDQRAIVVPVLARLPVLFVDQYGDDENPRQNRYGETFHMRRWLAPVTSAALGEKRLVDVRHLRLDQLDREALADARLVVIAGVASPRAAAGLLREYVEQGGNLVIAAGGEFDPALWTQEAWLSGEGILPAPLEAAPIGRLPEESPGQPEWFQLDFESLRDNEFFALEGVLLEQLEDLYGQPYFFKAVVAAVSPEVESAAVAAVAERIRRRRAALEQTDRRLAELVERERRGRLSAAERTEIESLRRQRSEVEPAWLPWATGDAAEDGAARREPPEEVAARSRPVVLARYTNGLPFLVERRLGRGRVVLMTSGVVPEWNTLSVTDAVVLYDRILRGLIRGTLPPRNLSTERPLVVPIAAAERWARYQLVDPDGTETPLAVEALGGERYGLTIPSLARRGVYRLAALRGPETPGEGLETRLWEIALAANGPEEESRLLTSQQAETLRKMSRAGDTGQSRVATAAQAAIGAGAKDLWRWALALVLAGLLLELAVLAWPSLGRERT